MRVAEIARLTGTTVRTVRYYHSLGLLPVPRQRGAWRDYDLSHVARLSRIRWLTEAGVPLESVARMLELVEADSTGQQVTTDLEAALDSVEQRLTEVTHQRDMLASLVTRAHAGMTVTPMSDRMVAFFDRMEAQAPDEATRAAVRRERDVTELACYRGLIPPEAEFLFFDPDTRLDAEAIEAYGRDTSTARQEEIEAHADWLVRRVEDNLTEEQLRRLARTVDITMVEALYELLSRADPAYKTLGAVVGQRFIDFILRWRQT